jgi:hypothetical protein
MALGCMRLGARLCARARSQAVLVESWSVTAERSMCVLHVQNQVSDIAVLMEYDDIWQLQVGVRCM